MRVVYFSFCVDVGRVVSDGTWLVVGGYDKLIYE